MVKQGQTKSCIQTHVYPPLVSTKLSLSQMTNFTLFQYKGSADDNFKLDGNCRKFFRKTLWEKEKLLVMSNFSFSHSVFKRLVLQTRKGFVLNVIMNSLFSFYFINNQLILRLVRSFNKQNQRVESTGVAFVKEAMITHEVST